MVAAVALCPWVWMCFFLFFFSRLLLPAASFPGLRVALSPLCGAARLNAGNWVQLQEKWLGLGKVGLSFGYLLSGAVLP